MSENIKIVAVDSSALMISIYTEIVNATGNGDLIAAYNFDEAKNILHKEKINAIIIDLESQKTILDLKWLKEKYPSIITIIVSNYIDSFLRNLIMKSGADYCLDKYLEIDKIPAILSAVA